MDLLLLLVVFAVCAGALFSNIDYNRTHYTAEFYQISSRKLTHRIRFVFLSDVHLREYGEDNTDLVADIRNLAPDLILLGGDLVTYGVSGYDNNKSPLPGVLKTSLSLLTSLNRTSGRDKANFVINSLI